MNQKRKESEMTKPESSDHKYEVWLDLCDAPDEQRKYHEIVGTYYSYKEAKSRFDVLRKNQEFFNKTISIAYENTDEVIEEVGPRQILEASYAFRVEVDVQTIVENTKIADLNNDLYDLVDHPDGKIIYVTGNVHHEMDEIDAYVWQIRDEDGNELWAV